MSAQCSVRLGEVSAFVRGINFKPLDVVPIGTKDSVACMRTRNVQAELDLSDVWAVRKSFVKREDQFLRPGDILVSSANSWNLVGKCCWIPRLPWPASFGGFVSVLRANPAKVDPRYLFHWFSSERIQRTVRSLGQQTTNISNLNTERCLDLLLPLPPLPEQERIAGLFENADALRAKRRSALTNADVLAQAVFLRLFGDPATNSMEWPVTTLQNVTEQITDGEHLTPKRTTEGIKLLSARNIRDGELDFSNVDFIGPDEHERIKRRCNPSRGDVLISCSGSIGRVALVETDEPLSLVRSVAMVRPARGTVAPKFLEHYLRTPALLAHMLRRANASSQANLFQGQIRDLRVFLPPLELQREFERRVAAVDLLRTAQRRSLVALDDLFASLQHRAFRGEL